jgi:hypothetical protein
MNTITIGIVRPGKANNFVLNSETKYVAMCGTKPEVSFSIDCEQDEFLRGIDGLRYKDADPSASSESIDYMQKLVTQIFEQVKYLKIDANDLSPLHIRLITTPFELAQLPFEFVAAAAFVVGAENVPLLALPNRQISLTREVRQENDVHYEWPSKPRILFVWAQPGGEEMSVPHEEHLAVLKAIVSPLAIPKEDRPLPEPLWERLLTELPNASIQSIKNELAKGRNENAPYTHLHILAHGGVREQYTLSDFQLVLCENGTTDKPQKINGTKLSDALITDNENEKPTVVSLSVCDSGHLGNTIQSSGSLAYQLHMAGIPCVFASQFPLTQTGSVTLVRELYRRLLSSCDPREALYDTRRELRNEPTHDWASLVAYARFPDDIDKQLEDARLKAHFGSMKITTAWIDHTLKYWDDLDDSQYNDLLQDLENRLAQSINDLSSLLSPENKFESRLATVALRSEHLGLMASAFNR